MGKEMDNETGQMEKKCFKVFFTHIKNLHILDDTIDGIINISLFQSVRFINI